MKFWEHGLSLLSSFIIGRQLLMALHAPVIQLDVQADLPQHERSDLRPRRALSLASEPSTANSSDGTNEKEDVDKQYRVAMAVKEMLEKEGAGNTGVGQPQTPNNPVPQKLPPVAHDEKTKSNRDKITSDREELMKRYQRGIAEKERLRREASKLPKKSRTYPRTHASTESTDSAPAASTASVQAKNETKTIELAANATNPSDFDSTLNTNGCLLTKDDVSLVPEWIAYHYHAAQMRYLIIAVDPLSLTNVSVVLERFRRDLPDLVIDELNDADFMPAWFIADPYSHPEKLRSFKDTLSIADPVERRMRQAHKFHKYRQEILVHHCVKRVRERQLRALGGATAKPQPNWLMITDTDEYMVPNPKWRADPAVTSFRPSLVPKEATAGSVARYVRDVQRYFPRNGKHFFPPPSRVCMTMYMNRFDGQTMDEISGSTVRFSSPSWIDRAEAPAPLDGSRFNTLAYRAHLPILDGRGSDNQKAMLNVDVNGPLPKNDITVAGPQVPIIHQPSKSQCRTLSSKTNPFVDALHVQHFMGTVEQYLFREDIRRSAEEYKQKLSKNVQIDDGWITTWVKHFVALHGTEKVVRLLGEHFVQGGENQWVAEKARIAREAVSNSSSTSQV